MVNYRIKLDSGNERTYHINMLKKFISREPPDSLDAQVANSNEAVDDDVTSCTEDEGEVDDVGISAAVMGLIECSDDEDDESVQSFQETDKLQCYSTEQTETWKDVVINPELSSENRNRVVQLLKEFEDIFSDVPSKTHLITHKIKLKSDEPVYCKRTKFLFTWLNELKRNWN